MSWWETYKFGVRAILNDPGLTLVWLILLYLAGGLMGYTVAVATIGC